VFLLTLKYQLTKLTLVWILAALLPIPERPHWRRTMPGQQVGDEQVMTDHFDPQDVTQFRNARWRRTANRFMSLTGLFVIAAVVRRSRIDMLTMVLMLRADSLRCGRHALSLMNWYHILVSHIFDNAQGAFAWFPFACNFGFHDTPNIGRDEGRREMYVCEACIRL